MKYADYLKTPHWASIKAKFKRKSCWRCQRTNEETELHLHHRYYRRGGIPILLREQKKDLITLCGRCHRSVHFNDRAFLALGNPNIKQKTLNKIIAAGPDVGRKVHGMVFWERRCSGCGYATQKKLGVWCPQCGVQFEVIGAPSKRTGKWPLKNAVDNST